jgi:hypothetical protein
VPRLTIIIPWTGPVGPFEDTLAGVLQNRPAGCEVLVALAQPYEDPYHLGGEVTFLSPQGGKNDLVALVNRGVAASSAPIVHVVTCGLIASEGWTSAALLHFDDPTIAAVAPVLVNEQRPERIVSAGMNFTSAGARQLSQRGAAYDVARLVQSKPLAAPLGGGFFRKSVIEAIEGFDPSLGLGGADLDFALCAAELGLRTECEPTSILSGIATEQPSLATGRAVEQLFWRHLLTDERRTRVPQHYVRMAGELAYSMVQPRWIAHLAGRVVGWIGASFDRGHAARIAAAQERLASAPQILAFPRPAAGTSDRPAQRRAA